MIKPDTREFEEKFHLISENASDFIAIINEKFEFEFINKRLHENILGNTSNYKSALDAVHPDDREKAITALKDGFQKGYGMEEVRVKNKEGNWIWLQIKGKAFLDKGGAKKTLLISRDITEQKLIEEKYRTIYDTSPLSIVLVDFDGKLVDCNDAQVKIFGWEREELLGKDFRDLNLFTPESKPVILDAFNSVVKGVIPEPFEVRSYRKDGSVIWVLINGNVVTLGDKKLIQVISQNINDTKEAERKLMESEEKFRTISEHSMVAITIVQDDLIIYINQRWQKLSGYTFDEVKSWEPGEYLKLIHQDDREKVAMQEMKKQQGQKDAINQYQFRAVRKNGEIAWIDNYSKFITYNGKPAILGIHVDITDQKRAEEIIKQENLKLKELDDLKTDFISAASHEIKSPLTPIIGLSNLLLKKNTISKRQKDHLSSIYNNALKISDLINDLLDVSRIDTNNFKLYKIKSEVNSIIDECLSELKYLIYKKNHELTLNLDENVRIKIDRTRMMRVCTNLISNAIKYTPSGGKIEISTKIQNGQFLFSVEDNGIGFEKSEDSLVFKKFGKIERKNINQYDIDIQGTGLGLYITKKIIALHGGKIWYESEGRNKGTTFVFTIPIE